MMVIQTLATTIHICVVKLVDVFSIRIHVKIGLRTEFSAFKFETLKQVKCSSSLSTGPCIGGFGYKRVYQVPVRGILPQLLTFICSFTCSGSFLALFADLSETREVCFRLVCLAFLM